jgi:hypothetical protein
LDRDLHTFGREVMDRMATKKKAAKKTAKKK